MKLNSLKKISNFRLYYIVTVALIFLSNLKLAADETTNKCMSEKIISVCREGNIDAFGSVVDEHEADSDQISSNLLEIARSSQSNFSQAAAIYFLGEIRCASSVAYLAPKISFKFHGVIMKHLVKLNISKYPVMDALIKIGNPSILAVIQNLAKSDDISVRELSLKTLYNIDGDKDIVRLRLQKALKSEPEPQEQARLQMALKRLEETTFP